ncbi:MAG TPA: hypothetical protein VHD55_01530 [Candidatus Paceibacterota bacterium]|nr:hypothetical protein [Candidatus Paceibacterota bacterium]
MENNEKHDTMQEAVLRRIRADELSMRPRAYFALKMAAIMLVALAALLISVFIFNFILFGIRINSHDSLLGFGPRGIGAFLYFFPWNLLLIDVGLVLLLQWMLRWFRFGYKTPVLYLLLGILAATAAAAVLIDRGTDFNDRLLHRADRHELYFFGDFFEGARRPMPGSGVCKCTITAIAGSMLTVEDARGTTTRQLSILIPAGSPRATTTGLAVGDVVFIAGDADEGGVIRAFGVRKLPQGAMK